MLFENSTGEVRDGDLGGINIGYNITATTCDASAPSQSYTIHFFTLRSNSSRRRGDTPGFVFMVDWM